MIRTILGNIISPSDFRRQAQTDCIQFEFLTFYIHYIITKTYKQKAFVSSNNKQHKSELYNYCSKQLETKCNYEL